MIKEAIGKLVENQNLTYEEAKECMNEIMSGNTPEVLISAYLVALRMKGETIDEITGSAQGMRDNGTKLEHDMDLLEIVGTGGDKANTFNISTTSAIVAAAAGCKIAKHGNRGVSSKSGAADVLEAFEQAKEVLDKTGMTFLFAQKIPQRYEICRSGQGGARNQNHFQYFGTADKSGRSVNGYYRRV